MPETTKLTGAEPLIFAVTSLAAQMTPEQLDAAAHDIDAHVAAVGGAAHENFLTDIAELLRRYAREREDG